MTQIWITFRSLTHAQRAASLLERSGITALVTRAPKGLSAWGCSYAVILRKRAREAEGILQQARLPYGKLFERLTNGEFREVLT